MRARTIAWSRVVVAPKVAKFRKQFANRLRRKAG